MAEEPPPSEPPPPSTAVNAGGEGDVVDGTVDVTAAADPGLSAAFAQGDGEGGEKKSSDDDAGAAAAVIAEQTKLVNERDKTAAPDKNFESLSLLEKFR